MTMVRAQGLQERQHLCEGLTQLKQDIIAGH